MLGISRSVGNLITDLWYKLLPYGSIQLLGGLSILNVQRFQIFKLSGSTVSAGFLLFDWECSVTGYHSGPVSLKYVGDDLLIGCSLGVSFREYIGMEMRRSR